MAAVHLNGTRDRCLNPVVGCHAFSIGIGLLGDRRLREAEIPADYPSKPGAI